MQRIKNLTIFTIFTVNMNTKLVTNHEPTNFLSVFDHFVGLALKGLNSNLNNSFFSLFALRKATRGYDNTAGKRTGLLVCPYAFL